MRAIKKARRQIESDPTSNAGRTLSDLVLALESNGSFELGRIYDLDPDTCTLALELLEEWRLDRYYAGKARLFDLSWQARELPAGTDAGNPAAA